MFRIEHSSTGLGPDWEPIPESKPHPTPEEAREEARCAWASQACKRDWVRVIREGAKRPVFLFMGGRYRINSGKWQRVPARRIG